MNFGAIHKRISRPVTRPKGRLRNKREKDLSDISDIEVLSEYREILNTVRERRQSVFLSGPAGTGKTTAIQYTRANLDRCAVVAPTAVAAMNIGGMTLHSFFGIPPRMVDPKELCEPRDQIKPVVANLDVLIIDEVSMIPPNLIDCMDKSMRKTRDCDEPFGGVPVVFVGDLFQLPPVVKNDEEKKFYNERYDGSIFFFSAEVMSELELTPIQLTRSFRQQDPEFLAVLNNIRIGRDLENSTAYFNDRCIGKTDPNAAESTYLVPTNHAADARNKERLRHINQLKVEYEASFEGSFNPRTSRLPAPEKLELKCGARVVFLKNHYPDWINGTVGEVTKLETDNIWVRILKDGRNVSVPRETWNEYAQWYNDETERIENRITGTFTQFPLMAAWAMTIHKAQGMTLDSVRIDLDQGTFCTGQAYVALSRCRTVEGITLKRKIQQDDVQVDGDVLAFYRELGFLE